MDIQYIIKFTRCHRCHSFSLQESPAGKNNRNPGLFSKNMVVCTNCGNQYVLQGNNLKEINPLAEAEEPETQRTEPVVAKDIKNRTFSRSAIFLIVVLSLLAAGIVFLFLSHNPGQRNIQAAQPQGEEKTAAPQFEKEAPGLEAASTLETVPGESGDTPGESGADVFPETAEPPGSRGETGTDDQEIVPAPPGNTQPQAVAATGNNPDNEVEPTAYKIFEFSGMKVRASSPDSSDRSHRWYFNRKNITIKRSGTQRVVIAGDSTGKRKWAVDDEILINGERIKGCSEEITAQGDIPESNQVSPVDITHLVPSDRAAQLEIRLVDYGIYWGNTSLYIVVM